MTQEPIKIDQKIKHYAVVKNKDIAQENSIEDTKVKDINKDKLIMSMNESISRPELLFGSTYKISTPLSEHALYITINDIILNQDTEHEVRRPFEVFINSKNMEQFQWIVALTRILSAVFRKGGDIKFLVEELQSVFDPNGGYFKKGGKYMPSVVAEIGGVLKEHLIYIGHIQKPSLTKEQIELINEKKTQYEEKHNANNVTKETNFPETATLCKVCNVKAVVKMDNCETCLNCGDGKCG